jgi:dipeptidyl aminopeptidase/acylaminoacyl peptidase
MPLTPGTRLGAYEITGALGAGGMGEVYRARDTRLDRSVAIKVMPTDLTTEPQFRARFEREARAISQLQHPHICTLYDVGEADGTAFLVMELLQGQTLADRDPQPIADRVGSGPQTGESPFSASRSALAYTGNIDQPVTQLTWTDRSGRPGVSIGTGERFESPDVSADEQRVVVHRTDPVAGTDVYLIDEKRPGDAGRFTFDPAVDMGPIWSPDGRTVAFSSNRTGTFGVYARQMGAGGDNRLLPTTANGLIVTSWSADGKLLLYSQAGPKTGFDLWMLPLAGRRPTPVLNSPANETQGQLSTDGRWLVYTSDETGIPEVYVQPFPPTGAQSQVSSGGGSDPHWRRDGQELFYITLDGKLTAAQVSHASASFEVVSRQVLFQTRRPTARGPILFSNYRPSADGQRFLLNTLIEAVAPLPVFVSLDWSAGLKP